MRKQKDDARCILLRHLASMDRWVGSNAVLAYLPALPLPEGPVEGPCARGGVQDEEHDLGRRVAWRELLLHADDGAGVPLVLQVQRGLAWTANPAVSPQTCRCGLGVQPPFHALMVRECLSSCRSRGAS